MNEFQLTTRDISGDSVNTVNARDLHKALEVQKDFSDWIKNQIARCYLVEGLDFVIQSCSPSQGEQDWGGSNRIDYFLTTHAARSIAAISETEKGKEVRSAVLETVKTDVYRQKAHQKWHKAEYMLGTLVIKHLGEEVAADLYESMERRQLTLDPPKATHRMTQELRKFLQTPRQPLALQEFDLVVNLLSRV